ncbi:hypothetical protein AB0G05_00215 [Nonomuraea wenchangensis]
MPKLKSLITGLAVSTAMTGAAVAMGTPAANATPVTSLVSVATGDWDDDDTLVDGLGTNLGNNWGGNWNNWGGGWGHRRHERCHRRGGGWGGGWGWGRRGGGRICVVVRNHNRNINDQFEHDRRRRHHHNFDDEVS